MAIASGRGLPDWTAGTATATLNSRVVNFTGANLITTDPVTKVQEYVVGRGDLFVIDGVDAIPITEVVSANQVKLAKPWTAATQSNKAYAIIRMSVPATGTLAKAIQDLVNSGSNLNPDVSRYLDDSTARMRLGMKLGLPSISVGQSGAADGSLIAALQIDPLTGIVTFPKGAQITSAIGKNRTINGGFDIWQRGTSFTIPVNNNAFTADRWRVTNGSATKTVTVTKVTAPTGFRTPNAIRLSATAYEASKIIGLQQRYLAQTLYDLDSKECILSFDINASTSAGTLSGQVAILKNNARDNGTFNTGAVTINFTIPAGVGMVTVPITAAQSAGFKNGAQITIRITQNDAAGNITATLGTVQLELGKLATNFEFRQPADTYNQCLYYYERMPLLGFSGSVNGTTTLILTRSFLGVKRNATYDVTLLKTSFNASGAQQIHIGTGWPENTTATLSSSIKRTDSLRVIIAGWTGLTSGDAVAMNNSENFLDVDAEL